MLSELIREFSGLFTTLILGLIGYITVAYYERKAENERKKRILTEYDLHKKEIENELSKEDLSALIRGANLRLDKRRSEDE